MKELALTINQQQDYYYIDNLFYESKNLSYEIDRKLKDITHQKK